MAEKHTADATFVGSNGELLGGMVAGNSDSDYNNYILCWRCAACLDHSSQLPIKYYTRYANIFH